MDNVLLPPGKDSKQPSFEIEFDFAEDYHLDVNVHQVSNNARLAVTADGREVFSHYLIASDNGLDDWVHIEWNEQRNVYESISNRNYRAVIPAGTGKVVVMVTDGDWLSVNSLRFSAVGGGHTFDVMPNVHVISRPLSEPELESELISEPEPVSEPEPALEPEQIMEPERVLEPEQMSEPELESMPELEPTLEPEPVSEPEQMPEPELMSESDSMSLPMPEELIPIPETPSGQVPEPEPVFALIPANRPRTNVRPAPKRNPWLVGAAASIIALAAIALTRKRRR